MFSRQDISAAILAAAAGGAGVSAIADRLVISPSKVRRVLATQQAGAAGANASAPAAPAAPRGRPAAVRGVSREAIRLAAQVCLDTTDPSRVAHPRTAQAFRSLAMNRPELLPADMRERILAGGEVPESVRREVRQLCTQSAAALRRGPKAARLAMTYTPLDNTWVDAAGERRERRFGDWFVADDMHLNFPFWVETGTRWWQLASDAEAQAEGNGGVSVRVGEEDWRPFEAHGVRVVRAQLLAFLDAGTLNFIGNALWSQRTDAYGCYAIRWTTAQILAAVGMPRGGMRFENGAWKSKAHVVGPLNACGIHVINSQSANGKVIENRFNVFQDIMAARMRLDGRGHLNLGKERGYFEEGKRHWLQMRAGREDPRDIGVPHISEMQHIIAECFAEHNETVSKGKTCQGEAPEVLRVRHLSQDAPLRQLNKEEAFRLKPHRAEVSVLADGWVKVRSKIFGPQGAIFRNDDLFVALGQSYRVEITYDIADPEHAGVFSADPARRVTRAKVAKNNPEYRTRWSEFQLEQGIAPGEFLGIATLQARMPAEVLANWAQHREGHEARKAVGRYARANFQAIFPGRRRTALRDEAHDGMGSALFADGIHLRPGSAWVKCRPDPDVAKYADAANGDKDTTGASAAPEPKPPISAPEPPEAKPPAPAPSSTRTGRAAHTPAPRDTISAALFGADF